MKENWKKCMKRNGDKNKRMEIKIREWRGFGEDEGRGGDEDERGVLIEREDK